MDYDVYLYASASDEALLDGADQLAGGLPSRAEAVAFADRMVKDGHYARAVVGVGENVHEIYDTAEAGVFYELSPPDFPKPGRRYRPSSLAERALVLA